MTNYTGFAYEFDSLKYKRDELSVAFDSYVSTVTAPGTLASRIIKQVLITFAPTLLKLVRRVSSFLSEK